MGEIKKVVIVGAGFSGTLTATRLLQFADSPLENTIMFLVGAGLDHGSKEKGESGKATTLAISGILPSLLLGGGVSSGKSSFSRRRMRRSLPRPGC